MEEECTCLFLLLSLAEPGSARSDWTRQEWLWSSHSYPRQQKTSSVVSKGWVRKTEGSGCAIEHVGKAKGEVLLALGTNK